MQQENELFRWMESIGSNADLDSDQAFAILQCIAINPITPQAVLTLLAGQGSNKLLESVAGNPSCGAELMAQLACHQDSQVRIALCENPGISIDVTNCLLNDDSVDVRYALAENYQLPTFVLEQLCDDDNAYVAFRAKQTLQRLEGSSGLASKVVRWFSWNTDSNTKRRDSRLG